jgi:serpin B
MKQTLLTLWSLIVLSLPTTLTAQVQSLVASNTDFALNLYSQLGTNAGNLFLSPYSISTFLAMTYAGARGDTEAQMSQVLGFETNQQQFASLFGELQDELEVDQQSSSVQLKIANALWTQIGFPFLPSFLETATNQYQASVSQTDFATNAAGATQAINDWVAQETDSKIQNIVPPGAINADTVLVLANAIYFLGAWTYSFEVTNTTTEPFYLSSTNQEDVPLMYQPAWTGPLGLIPVTPQFDYLETNDFQALDLPYGTNEVASMLILLPSQIDGLSQLEQQLSPAFLSSVLAQMSPQYVNVFLPRFTLESFFSLSNTLANMGMPDAFTPGVADFSGIDGMDDLFISFVLHKAWGQVNEAGTEAAAATLGGSQGNGVGIVSYTFRADHPFVFFILDNQTGTILFMGRLADPGQSAPTSMPIPQLAITQSGNSLKIAWPFPSTPWTLRQNPDLTTTNWTPTGGISNDGTNNFITITPSAGNLFFRLNQQ